jgi:hypothetical protein
LPARWHIGTFAFSQTTSSAQTFDEEFCDLEFADLDGHLISIL